LRTPKATSIAAFALSGRDETLLVVNLHAVNFSFGLSDYKHQFHQVGRLLQGHEGPVILAGDFNTWHKRRMQVVDSLAESLDLQPVTFDDDTRMRFFGSALDHIYVRQLQLVNAETATVYTSDHNPLVAVLSMPFAAP
jgi:endonuclease/exonuclease/phosphatase (EEP) superfamily protein YafD